MISSLYIVKTKNSYSDFATQTFDIAFKKTFEIKYKNKSKYLSKHAKIFCEFWLISKDSKKLDVIKK